jgi:hypothetical protein
MFKDNHPNRRFTDIHPYRRFTDNHPYQMFICTVELHRYSSLATGPKLSGKNNFTKGKSNF